MKLTPASTETKSSKAPTVAPAITYKLSNAVFKSLGWTSLPENAIVVPVVTMKAKFSHSLISPWFAAKKRTVRTYRSGKPLCVSNGDGTGRIFYPNGKPAISIRKGGKQKEFTRIVVRTPGGVGRDGIRRQPQLCAIFDSLGNGVVYDCDKKKRLVYDQNHGMAWMKPGGSPIYWKWHNLRYAGSLTALDEDGDPDHPAREHRTRIKGKDMSVVAAIKRMESSVDATGPKTTSSRGSFTPTNSFWGSSEAAVREPTDESHYVNTALDRTACPMPPIIFQINSFIGMHILGQAEVALTFYADGHQTRLNIGVLYNPFDKLSVDKVYSSSLTEKVWCPFEVLPVKTRSMELIRQLIKKEKAAPCWNRV